MSTQFNLNTLGVVGLCAVPTRINYFLTKSSNTCQPAAGFLQVISSAELWRLNTSRPFLTLVCVSAERGIVHEEVRGS